MNEGKFMAPSRLTAAREFRGMTKKALAERLGVQPMTVTGYEAGAWQPARELLVEIARTLDFPLAWFLQEELALVEDSVPTFRAQSRMTARTRGQAARTWDIASLAAQYLRSRFNLPPVSLPDLGEETPETAAAFLRDEWRLGNEPIGNMVHLLESKGIGVFWTNIESQSLDACCHWSNDFPVILLNLNERSGERGRFNAAHELGHLVLHREMARRRCQSGQVDDVDAPEDSKQAEREANRFAGAFLLPRVAWHNESPLQPMPEVFIPHKSRWGVSIQAMIRRSYDLKLFSEWQYETAMTRLSVRGWRKAEPNALYPEHSLLQEKVFRLMAADGYRLEDLARELHLDPRDVAVLMPKANEFLGARVTKPFLSLVDTRTR